MDSENFLIKYERKNRKFPWVNLNKVDLTDANIPNVNLSRGQLKDAILIRTNLSESNLIKANLTDANLTNANLTGVNFYKANLTGAILEGAILERANLTGVNLDEVYFHGAIMPDGKVYEEWILDENPCLNPALERFNKDTNIQTQLEEETEEKFRFAKASSNIFPAFNNSKTPPPDLSHLTITDKEFRYKLPYPPLAFLGVGNLFYGMILINCEASPLLWLFAWGGSLVWYLDKSLIWFVPMK